MQKWLGEPDNQERPSPCWSRATARRRGGRRAAQARDRGGRQPAQQHQRHPRLRRRADRDPALAGRPQSASQLSKAYRVWRKAARLDEPMEKPLDRARAAHLHGPPPRRRLPGPPARQRLAGDFRPGANRRRYAFEQLAGLPRAGPPLAGARSLLPVDQLVLTLAQDIFTEPADLAVAHKMASLLRQRADAHPDWQLPELSEEVARWRATSAASSVSARKTPTSTPTITRARWSSPPSTRPKGWNGTGFTCSRPTTMTSPPAQLTTSTSPRNGSSATTSTWRPKPWPSLKAALSTDEYDWYEEGQATRVSRAGLRPRAPAPVLTWASPAPAASW